MACGDFNVAYQPIDIARPKENYNKKCRPTLNRKLMVFGNLLNAGFCRYFQEFSSHGSKVYLLEFCYQRSVKKNIGWRIDHFSG